MSKMKPLVKSEDAFSQSWRSYVWLRAYAKRKHNRQMRRVVKRWMSSTPARR